MCVACPEDTLIIVYAHLFLSNKRSKSVLIIVMYVYTFNCYCSNYYVNCCNYQVRVSSERYIGIIFKPSPCDLIGMREEVWLL